MLEPHAKSLLDLRDRVRVVWAAAPREGRPQQAVAPYGFPATTDIEAAIRDPAVDAVLVLTPANAHLPIAEAGVRRRQARAVRKAAGGVVGAGRAADRSGRSGRSASWAWCCSSALRPGSQRLKQVLKAGELGDVQAAAMAVPWWRPQAYYDQPGRGMKARDGGGVLMIQAIHTLDLFRWLVGIRSVQAAQVRTTALHRMETEDYASALVRLGNGAPGSILATVAAYPGSAEWIQVIGARGTAWLEGGNLRIGWLDGREERLADDSGSGSGANLMGFSHEPHKAVLRDFLDAIEQDRDPAIAGEEALATQRVIDDIIDPTGRD